MKPRRSLAVSAFGVLTLWCAAAQASAQVAPSPQGQITLSEPSPPIYPPLARAARVLGDVEIAVRIRQDGTVESAEVVSGHPLLKAAALDSARRSKFECHECREVLTSYSILYTFGFTTTPHCCKGQKNPGPGSLNRKTTSQFSPSHYASAIRPQISSRFAL
jgi:TonB family protein